MRIIRYSLLFLIVFLVVTASGQILRIPPNTTETSTLTVTQPSNGVISGWGISCGTSATDCTESFLNFTTVTITATPDSGSTFTSWGGACAGSGSTCTLTMNAAKNVTATFTVSAPSADRYASPTGSGSPNTCTSSASPCTYTRAQAVALCGETIGLQDGTYTTASGGLLATATALHPVCTSGAQMTVTAINDGAAKFRASSSSETPCKIENTTYWNFTGFNCDGGTAGADGALWVKSSNHINVRRICGWEAHQPGNVQVGIVWDSSNTLVEDSCFFGIGTQAFEDFGSNTGVLGENVYRRLYLRHEGGDPPTGGASVASQYNYTDNNFATPSRVENLISVSGPLRGGLGYSLFYGTNTLRHNSVSPYVRFTGMMDYAYNSSVTFSSDGLINDGAYSGVRMQDWVAHSNGASMRPFFLRDGSAESPVQSSVTDRLTSIYGSAPVSNRGSIYTHTNFVEGATVAATGFNYQGASGTARLCFQVINGTITTIKLWPWPMDNRIRDAVADSNSSASPLHGSAGTGYAANTVTSEVVSIFGAIPSQCIN